MAIYFVFSGNTYPHRRLFRDVGPGVEFRNQTREWWVPADTNGEVPYSLSRPMVGVNMRRVVTQDEPTQPEVKIPPQAPSVNPTRETVRNPPTPPQKPARTRRPIGEVSEEVAAENALESVLEANNGELGENHQEPASNPNDCPF